MLSRRDWFLASAAMPASSALAQTGGGSGKEVVISSANGLAACDKALEIIRGGGDTLDAVVAGVNIVEDDPKEWVLADVDFHVALFTATGNVFLEQLARIIRTALLATFEVSTRQADSNTESLRLHGELVDHIRLRNAEAARADMVQLVKVAEGHLSGSPRGKTRARPGRAAATKRAAGQSVALPSRK